MMAPPLAVIKIVKDKLKTLVLIFLMESILYAKIMLSQKFRINYKYFTSVVLCTQTRTTPTVITYTCVLQKTPFCNDSGYKFEFENVDQIGTSVIFWPKKVKC